MPDKKEKPASKTLFVVLAVAVVITIAVCLAIVVSFSQRPAEKDGLDEIQEATSRFHDTSQKVEESNQGVEEACKELRAALEKSRQYRNGEGDPELEEIEKQAEEQLKDCPDT